MEKEILEFCLRKGLLLDKDVLKLFEDIHDTQSIKLIIERIKNTTNQSVITKSLFSQNKDQVSKVLLSLPEESQKSLEKFRIKLGLSIEISKEIEISKSSSVSGEDSLNSYDGENGVKVLSNTPLQNKKLEVPDFVKYFRNRYLEMRKILQEHSELNNPVSINKLSGNSQGVSIIGIVSNKSVTKNKNILLEVEDLTGKIKVLINQNKPELYKEAEQISLDSVLGFKGSGNKEIFFVNELVFPDSMIFERKSSPVEEYALFIGDLHFGSKRFLKNGFMKFIDYLNGKIPNTPEVPKIKYLFLVGDVVTGVGNYPDQEKDLEIYDLEEQFTKLAELLSRIKSDIKIIISPGNHDGVRLMEPQPFLNERYAWPLFNMKNVILTENPCNLNIGAKEGFSGFDILTYHGFSYFYYANTVPDLISKKAANSPEEMMKYLLKYRHLAPSHGSTQYYPFEEDPLIMKNVPDIFVSGHTHKCGVTYYNNVLIISVACWEAMTPYQEKFGNQPDHCKVPLVNLKTRNVRILDFEDPDETEEKGV